MVKCLPIILTFLVFNSGFILNQKEENSAWELIKSSNEISIYTRTVGYSDYKEFKGEMVITCSPDSFIAFIKDINNLKNWLPGCLESKKLAQINASQQINYILTDVPWPYNDRDLVYRLTVIDKDSKSGNLKLLIENKPEYIQVKTGIIRIPESNGFWTITPVSENKIKVAYQMHLDPGGYVPAWLINLTIANTPYTFLYNLRKQLEKI